jgi:transcriptional regulator with XRE-family HTH domain
MLDSKVPKPETYCIDRHIGGRAAERREALGLSLGDVAQALEVDGALLAQLEGGRRRFAARQLWMLSRRLQVPMAWFFMVPGEPPQRARAARTTPTDPAKTRLVFVPNPDLDRSDDADPVRVH